MCRHGMTRCPRPSELIESTQSHFLPGRQGRMLEWIDSKLTNTSVVHNAWYVATSLTQVGILIINVRPYWQFCGRCLWLLSIATSDYYYGITRSYSKGRKQTQERSAHLRILYLFVTRRTNQMRVNWLRMALRKEKSKTEIRSFRLHQRDNRWDGIWRMKYSSDGVEDRAV